jgi:hypothetical protein
VFAISGLVLCTWEMLFAITGTHDPRLKNSSVGKRLASFTRRCALAAPSTITHSVQTHIMIAEDPIAHVGSGGATLNALLSVTEFLSSLEGHTVVNPEALHKARILILHLVSWLPWVNSGRCVGGWTV